LALKRDNIYSSHLQQEQHLLHQQRTDK